MNSRPTDARSPQAAERRWNLADAAVKAQAQGANGLAELAEETGMAASTLRRWARVAKEFPPPRRRGAVSFSIHEAAVGRPDRYELLDRADREQLSVADVRATPRVSNVVRSGPESLVEAIRYIERLVSVGAQPQDAVRRGARLADLTSELLRKSAVQDD
jgi:hypothetical protein